jgi:hypothetical protein
MNGMRLGARCIPLL